MRINLFIALTFIVFGASAKTVDLSNKHMKKEEFFLQIQKQIHLAEVTNLILRGNEFDSFLDCSTNLENLRFLDLSHNHLQRFFFLCKDEYNLESLNVSNNRLEYIDDNALNDRMPKLKILDLSDNQLSIVNETMLQYLTNLEFLSVANNPIEFGIHENAFWNLTALKHLDLRNVSVTTFVNSYFKTLANLTTLDLSWNPITWLPSLPVGLEELDLSGTRLTRLNNLFLPQLRELRLNHMPNMTVFILNDLANLTNLQILSLIGCKNLTQLRVLPHEGLLLPRLKRLLINDCALENLSPELQSIIEKIPVVEVKNNPWKCDCNLQWLANINTTSEMNREIECTKPIEHRGKTLRNIPVQEMRCEYITPAFYPVIWTCGSLLVFVVILIGIIFVLRRQLVQWVARKRSRDTVTYSNVVESSNDLVRILPVGDAQDRNDD